ncbi:hypothetical protein Arub01_25570 [Actinomadura rubrobrunea]|uniref:HNH endonuclease n=1 Tax=Actinomadura rubrobrunea TaxID=115335 RepID=A0A9W6PWR1_9ACTN|nr:HNH endonuclease signature motif containing protein [Actinomadura rubrobrunea]GLW64313.1 hypothetical protein Arub01_25570 [Actinomadura rubrobrunea]
MSSENLSGTILELIDSEAVRRAAKEHDELGRQAFLVKHGFGAPGHLYVQVDGRLYPAEAIASVALDYQYPQRGRQGYKQVLAGESKIKPVLQNLGFSVFADRADNVEGERLLRRAIWQHIRAVAKNGLVAPGVLRELGAYGGGQGIWVDAARTKALHPRGVAVGVLHTGEHYPDDLDEHGMIYHYPSTNRPPSRDASEVEAMKAAADLQLPIFVISKPTPNSTLREVKLGWIAGWAEESKIFLILFGEEPPRKVEKEDRSDDEPFIPTGNRSRSAVRSVRHRPDQATFRLRVLQRYGPRCPLSGVAVLEMLEAVHFIPDYAGGSPDPRNGIPMNAALHRAFDAGLFAIHPDTLKVEVVPGGPTLEDLGIRFPSISNLPRKPHRDALEWRYEWWKRKNYG